MAKIHGQRRMSRLSQNPNTMNAKQEKDKRSSEERGDRHNGTREGRL